mmetsp:Transcript_7063/g.11897  ORF Transcript_7063/g.11897 Transcript_7063/m.11897 type:complete len:132 (-) Transcript_7063:547-942(-)
METKVNNVQGNPEEESKGNRMTKHDHLHSLVDEEVKKKWEDKQNELKSQLIEDDDFAAGSNIDALDLKNTLKLIGAVDIGYSKQDDRKAVAYIVICEYPSMNVVYEDYHSEEHVDFPYIPGFLAFKEIPVY